MSSLKLELRKMILKEMRKREFGESPNPDWNSSNMRLLDIISEELAPSNPVLDDPAYDIGSEMGDQQASMTPSWGEEFPVWNPEEVSPEPYDWGFGESEPVGGQQVDSSILDKLTNKVSEILNTPVDDFGGTTYSPEMGGILGRIASVIESIKSRSYDSDSGSLGADDVADLKDIAMGTDAEILSQQAPELLATVEQLIPGVA